MGVPLREVPQYNTTDQKLASGRPVVHIAGALPRVQQVLNFHVSYYSVKTYLQSMNTIIIICQLVVLHVIFVSVYSYYYFYSTAEEKP